MPMDKSNNEHQHPAQPAEGGATADCGPPPADPSTSPLTRQGVELEAIEYSPPLSVAVGGSWSPVVPSIDSHTMCNALMMSQVYRNLPTSRHHAWACSAGSTGYCATKDMLQNGTRGHTLLIESRDLRDVGETSHGVCCLIYNLSEEPAEDQPDEFNDYKRIPATVQHITAYSNSASLQDNFLAECSGLTSLDLSPLSLSGDLQHGFLSGCSGLTTIDLSPLSQITEIGESFLSDCEGLTELDLSALSQVVRFGWYFLCGCSGLTSLDISPMTSLTSVDDYFANDCTGLRTINMGAPRLENVHTCSLEGTDGVTSIHLSLIHISEPTRLLSISYAVFCLKKKKKNYI
eukprot:TRINITY_DN10331_c0_g1_i3.p1 TRINITY_DN10331_c0_g1~~TRINITY_DN10331_c0_g1_i3.p1  ORF type:complete len:347 (-),score=42.04 TRINITY_DN10331_c0_g1_i3:52-1092(-)